ncbi:hypothetical protein DL93DRAFT_1698021 [Clavulina sp. PMI_390]|nr:hypothetical protein DL93DRAFT_1698021 [Clavulina sp. PMI_390]
MTAPLDALSTSPSRSSRGNFHSFRSDPSDQSSAAREDPSSPLDHSFSPSHAPEDIVLYDPATGSTPSTSSSAPTPGAAMLGHDPTSEPHGPSAVVEEPASSSSPQAVLRAQTFPQPEKPKKKRKTRAQRRKDKKQRELKRQANANNQAQVPSQTKSVPKPKTEAQKAAQEEKRKRKAEKKARKKQAKAAAAAGQSAGVATATASKSSKKKAKIAKSEVAGQLVQQSANPPTLSSAIPRPKSSSFPINEENENVNEEVLRVEYSEAVEHMNKYVNSSLHPQCSVRPTSGMLMAHKFLLPRLCLNRYLANRSADRTPADRLSTARALLIELGVVTSPYTALPSTATSARKYLAAHVHINIAVYLKVRDQGLAALQGVLRASKSQLKKELREEKKKGKQGKKVTPAEAKKLGLNDLLVLT